MRRSIIFISTALALGAIPGACNLFKDFDDVEEECPFNSGYPCACDPDQVECADGSGCFSSTENPIEGFCLKPCDGEGDTYSCRDTRGYGIEGHCVPVGDPSEPYCMVVCGLLANDNPCPPGLSCLPGSEDEGECFPPSVVKDDSPAPGCECQEGDSLCEGTDLNLCVDGCHWTTGDCDDLCIGLGLGATGSIGCGYDVDVGQDNCVCTDESPSCDCSTEQYGCEGEDILICDDGCNWALHDCDQLCIDAEWEYSTGCSYVSAAQHDQCSCV